MDNDGEAFGVFKPTAIGAYSVFENALNTDAEASIQKRRLNVFENDMYRSLMRLLG